MFFFLAIAQPPVSLKNKILNRYSMTLLQKMLIFKILLTLMPDL